MRLRLPLFALPLVLLAFLASGCFSSRTAGTVSTPITVQSGTVAKEVNPASSSGGTAATTSGNTTSTAATTSSSTTSATGGGNTAAMAAAKTTFSSTCGGCHTLADAGTHGNVGPNLDQLKPDEATVAHQIQHGGGAMPAGLLSGDKLTQVAQYVSSVAGKSAG
jgi:mono/diheme cytochrome c family protein